MLFAQIPDPKPIIEAAREEAGWTAGLLAFIMVATIGFLVWLVKQWIKTDADRENRMAKRIDGLEGFIQEELVKLIDKCQASMEASVAASRALTDTLRQRPCLDEKD